MVDRSANSSGEEQQNPFPGLRPYHLEESEYYYVDQHKQDYLLSRLNDQKFLALVGKPSSGKASLINCALIPRLRQGFKGRAGSKWNCSILRPGTNPIMNLAEHLASSRIFSEDGRKEPNFASKIEKILRRSSNGLVEVFEEFPPRKGHNLLIAIDEFEDIFILKDFVDDQNDIIKFVNLLLRFLDKGHTQVYVILAISSDYLGESGQYAGLPEVINRGRYLITKPDKTHLEKQIEHALHAASISFDQQFIEELLDEYDNSGAHIYQLQYLFKRLIDFWRKEKEYESTEQIDRTFYESQGEALALSKCIGHHAEEIFKKFNSRDKNICELLFKALTKDQNIGVENSIAIEVNKVARIANCEPQQVVSVISQFIQRGLHLIDVIEPDWVVGRLESLERLVNNPFAGLAAYSKIMLMSPVIIESWPRLQQWSLEERESAGIYLDLVNTELQLRNSQDKSYDPLERAVIWRDTVKPNEDWASRYAPSFEEALQYLKDLEEDKEKKETARITAEQSRIRRNNQKYAAMGVVIVIVMALAGWAFNAQIQAKKDRERLNFIQGLDSLNTLYVDALQDVDSHQLYTLVEDIKGLKRIEASILEVDLEIIEASEECKNAIIDRIELIHQEKNGLRNEDTMEEMFRIYRLHEDSISSHNFCIVFCEHCPEQLDIIKFFKKKCDQDECQQLIQ